MQRFLSAVVALMMVATVEGARTPASNNISVPFDIGPEFGMDEPIYEPEANNQSLPAIAFDGANYLVVWVDDRGGSNNIYGTRVSAEGAILDTDGIKMGPAGNDVYYRPISVAFDDANYFVVWHAFNGSYGGIYGIRVKRDDGTVRDNIAIAISTAADSRIHPAVAFDGTNYFVVWEDYRAGKTDSIDYGACADIYGARVKQDGTVLDYNGILLGGGKWWCQEYPAIAFDGTNYLVVWDDTDMKGIYGTRVSTDGTVLDSPSIAISNVSMLLRHPAIAFDGTNYLVAWNDYRNHDGTDIYGARVMHDGTVLDSSGIAISTAVGYQGPPTIAFDGVDYLVFWHDDRTGNNYDIYGVRINQDGAFVGTDLIISNDVYNEVYPAIAMSNDGKALIAYSHFDDRTEYNSYRVVGRLYPFDEADDADLLQDLDAISTDEDIELLDEMSDELADTDSVTSDEQTPVDTDTAKPNGASGCGCSTVF